MVKAVRVSQWSAFAECLLEACYDATLSAATCLSAQRGERIRVYLTLVGGGPLGNRREWIVEALDRALTKHADHPLDVMLVHYGEVPHCKAIAGLESNRNVSEKSMSTCQLSNLREERAPNLEREMSSWHGKQCHEMLRIFEKFDKNGDGYIDRADFTSTLLRLNPDFFTPRVIELLLAEADADGDDEIHYIEFAQWLCGEDEDIYNELYALLEEHKVHV